MKSRTLLIVFGALVIVTGSYLALDRFIWIGNNTANVNISISKTNVIHYVPSLTSLPTTMENGSCFVNSVAAPYRPDAWRCFAGNGNSIADPCFQISGSQDLLCDPDPTEISATSTFVLRLTKSLPKPSTPSGTPVTNWGWFIELSDGTTCTPFTGTLPFSAQGNVAHYSCNSVMPGEDMLFDAFNSSSTLWIAKVGSLSDSGGFPPALQSSNEVPIQSIWQ
jgi:hypothetical protein